MDAWMPVRCIRLKILFQMVALVLLICRSIDKYCEVSRSTMFKAGRPEMCDYLLYRKLMVNV